MKQRTFIDQYGHVYYTHTIKELRGRLGGRCSKMYIDKSGQTIHVGYVIGVLWLTEYAPVERPC